jgi:hypothetical protein
MLYALTHLPQAQQMAPPQGAQELEKA